MIHPPGPGGPYRSTDSCRLEPLGGIIHDERRERRHPFESYLRRPSRRRHASVVRTYHDFVRRTAYRIAGNEDEARDVCQDVFLKLLLEPPAPGSIASVHGYLTCRVLARVQTPRGSLERRQRKALQDAPPLIIPFTRGDKVMAGAHPSLS